MTRALSVAVAGVLLAGCAPPTPAEIAARASTVVDGRLTACVALTPRLVQPADDDGLDGFDVEALEDVAGQLELELALVEVSFDELVSGEAVNDSRCDIGAAGIVAGGDVEQLVRPTVAYRDVDRLVVAPADRTVGSPTTLRVGVEDGGPAADAVDALTAAEVVLLPSQVDLLRVAAVGDVDAVLVSGVDVPAVREVLGEVVVVDRVPTGDRTIMVLPRGVEEAFAEVVDDALTAFATGPAGEQAARRWLDG